MNKLQLKNVTILSYNCVDPIQSIKALLYSSKQIDFAEMILVSHELPKNLPSNIRYVNTEKTTFHKSFNFPYVLLPELVETDYLLSIHDDGFVINPHLWSDEFLNYDYIGAPWKNHDWCSVNRVGNGGFCLRSKKFLQFSSQFNTCEGIGEDSYLCTSKYLDAIDYGIKFAPLELSMKFSYENPLGNWNQKINFDEAKHFGWHGKNFINTSYLLNLKHTI